MSVPPPGVPPAPPAASKPSGDRRHRMLWDRTAPANRTSPGRFLASTVASRARSASRLLGSGAGTPGGGGGGASAANSPMTDGSPLYWDARVPLSCPSLLTTASLNSQYDSSWFH